jgi:hypothetical protein
MANNFKDTANFYVAKSPAGHDSNDSNTPNTPRASLRIISGDTLRHVIGAGVYGPGTFSPTVNQYFRYRADGKVIFKNIILNAGGGPILFGIDCYDCSLTAASTRGAAYSNGIYVRSQVNSLGTLTINGCIIIDSEELIVGRSNESGTSNFNNSIIINCQNARGTTDSQALGAFFNNFIDFNSIIRFDREPNRVRNCNIQGLILIMGTYFSDELNKLYAIQDQLTGTPQDNGYQSGVKWFNATSLEDDGYLHSFTEWDTMISSCINRNPKFNNEAVFDFSLQSDSPHIGRAADGISNIGGTQIAFSVINTDDGIGDTEVIPSAEIDTTVPLSYQLESEETEGFVDYIFKVGSDVTVLGIIRPLVEFNFNSDAAGGTSQNNNVPDSEPLSADYPRKLTTTSAAPDTVTLVVSGNDAVVGEWVRVNGQDREITDVVGDDITVDPAFASSIGSGVTFQIATESELGALRPNRLTYLIRTSTNTPKPVVDADWDNGIDPIYGAEGLFLTQEWYKVPGYIIDNLDDDKIYGSGDSDAPTDITVSDMVAIWVQIRVYLRNDYES